MQAERPEIADKLKRALKDGWTPGIRPDDSGYIDKAQEKIDYDWLMLHYKIVVGLVLFALAVECVLGGVFIHSNLLTTTVSIYIWKYIVFPGGCNLLIVAVISVGIKSARISETRKAYLLSLASVGICFVLFTVHSFFTAAYYTYMVAILLTTVYADQRISWVTEVTSMVSLTISELFITWDADKVSIFESFTRMGNFLTALVILPAFSVMCAFVIRFIRKRNEASRQGEIERQQLLGRLQIDELTGVFNRQALHTAMTELESAPPDQSTFLAMVDLDNFKGINDRWGHHLGDCCLNEFAKVLKEDCGGYLPYRYGGDEFCLLFQNVGIEQVRETCERLREKVRTLHLEEEPELCLTVSIGLAERVDQEDGERLFINADRALYEAKKQRDALRIFPETLGESNRREQHYYARSG